MAVPENIAGASLSFGNADEMPLAFARCASMLCSFAGVSGSDFVDLIHDVTGVDVDRGEVGDWLSGKHLPHPRNKQLIWESLATRLRSRSDLDDLRKQLDLAYARSSFARSSRRAVARVRANLAGEVSGTVTPGLPTDAQGVDQPLVRTSEALRKGLPFGPEISIWPGAEHPEHPGVAHPDNREALGEIWSLFDRVNLREQAFTERMSVPRHFWALGSSTSTAEVTDVLGSVIDGAYSGWGTQPPVPVKWAFGRTVRKGRRFVEGREVHRALTGLYETKGATLIVDPRLDGDWLDTDYVLITRMPNVLSLEAFEAGLSFVDLAGLTGVGTKAIAFALRQDRVVRELAELAARAGAYQVILRVGGINNDATKATSKAVDASEIEVIEAVPLSVDEKRIRSWIEARGGHRP